jgi:hypothetical protein
VEGGHLKTGDGRVSSSAAYDKSNNNYDTSPKIKGITLDDASNAVGVSKCPIGSSAESNRNENGTGKGKRRTEAMEGVGDFARARGGYSTGQA